MPAILGKEVGTVGYGMMGLTVGQPTPLPRDAQFAAMKEALANGCNFWNAGEFYGPAEDNSLQLLEAYFEKYPEDASKVVLSIKGGYVPSRMEPDNSPAGLRSSVENCVRLLKGRKTIDVFEPARADPNVPVEEAMRTLVGLRDEGLFRGIGLSEVSAETVKRAAAVAEIASVEIEVSLWSTEALTNGLLETCRSLEIPIAAYSPLGKGFLTGEIASLDDLPANDMRRHYPRFQQETFANNVRLVHKTREIADAKGCKLSQVAIAWVRSLGNDAAPVVPIPGASSVARVAENSTVVSLTADELRSIDEILKDFRVEGKRYPGKLAEQLDG